MTISYDIQPTEPLSGTHMLGTVVRRFLISYAVPPEALTRHIPPEAEFVTVRRQGLGLSAFCPHERRASILRACTIGNEGQFSDSPHAGTITISGWKTKRESVLVLEPHVDRPLLA